MSENELVGIHAIGSGGVQEIVHNQVFETKGSGIITGICNHAKVYSFKKIKKNTIYNNVNGVESQSSQACI